MEAAIDLRQKYDAGEPGGLNIQVVNLSLGGPTNAAARNLANQAVEALLAADIVPAVAAGNEGFSSVTIGSPGTSFAALTVGSASSPQHEHIFRAQFSMPCATAPIASVLGCAQAFRPDTNMQISEFSSRGPTHDGRIDPDVVAVGSFNFSQGSGGAGTVNVGSGTSFATPTVAGIAAVLRQAVPTATARQIRNAIIMSAEGSRVPTADVNDQGAGFVNAAAARRCCNRATCRTVTRSPGSPAPPPEPAARRQGGVLGNPESAIQRRQTRPGDRHPVRGRRSRRATVHTGPQHRAATTARPAEPVLHRRCVPAATELDGPQ